MSRRRSPEREATISRAREWRKARDEARLPGSVIAQLVGLPIARLTELLCARAEPNEVERWSIDMVLHGGEHGLARYSADADDRDADDPERAIRAALAEIDERIRARAAVMKDFIR